MLEEILIVLLLMVAIGFVISLLVVAIISCGKKDFGLKTFDDIPKDLRKKLIQKEKN